MPAVARQVLDGLFPLRMQVSQMILRTHADLSAPEAKQLFLRVALRAARLEAFLAFPPSEGIHHARRTVVKSLKAGIADLSDLNRLTVF